MITAVILVNAVTLGAGTSLELLAKVALAMDERDNRIELTRPLSARGTWLLAAAVGTQDCRSPVSGAVWFVVARLFPCGV
ncbi:hypothetical protein [Lentzea flaviverrucosa]|uniref:hypothetical protein n=1 Tax=Lentzea flaviverrucosa TaxID=200379 RepID=UPI000B80230B|nr:hypothetical protein [Lentzea flaviverrucosa]